MKRYNPKEIEAKWQKVWADTKLYAAKDFDETRPKYVMLTEFPYPSGDGLHLGHVREYTLGDIMARGKRMRGYNVLYPMGFDSFGLPTENYAIKNKIAPQVATARNIATFRQQFDNMGFSFDWDRSFSTTDPDYYKWTQWLFLRFFKAGLAFQDDISINWCPHCKTGLANEEVVNGRHERCDTLVEKKQLKQWLLKITKYADRLIDGLQNVDYPTRIADQQINWIGRSKGAEVTFKVDGHKEEIKVFTTRPDTLFGATFMVLAPEHPSVDKLTTDEHRAAVHTYVKATQAKSEVERQDTSREKTGVFTGAYAINPVNDEKIPVWVADYALMGYGTGAIMAVPAHDERDYAFADKFGIPIKPVIEPVTGKPNGDDYEKEAIVAVVHDPKANKTLMLDWGPRRENWGGTLFIGGGVDDGEDLVKAAEREIAEETGYTNLKFVRQNDVPVNNYYFSNVKQRHDKARMHGMLFELVNDERKAQALDEGEKNKFKVVWVNDKEVVQKVSDAGHELVYQMLMNGGPTPGEGVMINSGKYNGLSSSLMREKIVADLAKRGVAKERVNYKIRDWIFSRQHYWGEPIPIIHCPEHGAVAVPEDQLPVELPPVEHYEPTDTGESPLAAITDWVNITCPICGKPAKRETDTMPNWAGSSWYYLRYFDAHNNNAFADRKKMDYWGEVDLYLGGMEHTTLHLLYSRFWHQFFYDQGLVPTPEPYAARRGQGIILAADGTKMSKSKGNVINPNTVIEDGYGADALRVAIAFIAPYDQTTPWNPEGVAGTYRFLNRVWTLTHEYMEGKPVQNAAAETRLARATAQVTKKVTEDLHSMAFNTAIAALMEYVNELYKVKVDLPAAKDVPAWDSAITGLLQLIAPFAPHMTEELWHELGNTDSVHLDGWPAWDESALQRDVITIVVQVNGKVRANLEVAADATKDVIETAALDDERIKQYVTSEPKRVIYVPGKLVNIVV